MKIALVSARPKIADKKSNLKTMENYIKKTKADFYVFGEMFLSGYPCKDEFRNLAEAKNGPSIKQMKKIAKEKKCYIVFGMPLKDGKVEGIIYNSAIFFSSGEIIHNHKKVQLPNFGMFEEALIFKAGEDFRTFRNLIGWDSPCGSI